MSRSFDTKLVKIREFYQVFNLCAVHVYESFKTFRYLVKVMYYMKRSLLYGINLSRIFFMLTIRKK